MRNTCSKLLGASSAHFSGLHTCCLRISENSPLLVQYDCACLSVGRNKGHRLVWALNYSQERNSAFPCTAFCMGTHIYSKFRFNWFDLCRGFEHMCDWNNISHECVMKNALATHVWCVMNNMSSVANVWQTKIPSRMCDARKRGFKSTTLKFRVPECKNISRDPEICKHVLARGSEAITTEIMIVLHCMLPVVICFAICSRQGSNDLRDERLSDASA